MDWRRIHIYHSSISSTNEYSFAYKIHFKQYVQKHRKIEGKKGEVDKQRMELRKNEDDWISNSVNSVLVRVDAYVTGKKKIAE